MIYGAIAPLTTRLITSWGQRYCLKGERHSKVNVRSVGLPCHPPICYESAIGRDCDELLVMTDLQLHGSGGPAGAAELAGTGPGNRVTDAINIVIGERSVGRKHNAAGPKAVGDWQVR